MARTKEFDPEAALGRALDLFWERGYEKSSMQDLVGHMKVGRRSVYDTYGSKHRLFLRALDSYITAAEGVQRGIADEAVDARRALGMLLATSLAGNRGCFAVNSATEVAPHAPDVAERIERHFAVSARLVRDLVERGQREGSVTGAHDAGVLAGVVFDAWLGLRVRVRSAGAGEDVRAGLRRVLSLLG
ncbi:TetR/AcrR family transcriptional regulator [Streptomyces rubiginosohelvolus]|uniref:TetR/AcrR family transcriptional regulator n=1 Tax=Streptomyces rubiginosohelvolus TaxID=67362 RepID=A0ABW6ET57_9ACTN